MGQDKAAHRVVMAKLIAARWLESMVHPEYRMAVYYGPRDIKNLPNLLRSFRDGKLKVGSVDPIPDLGIREEFDHLVIWSSEREGLLKLQGWFEERECETSGIW